MASTTTARARTEGPVYIGGASGALNDSEIAVPGLLRAERLDYLIFDYLGEGAMALFAHLKRMNPQSGFLPDFVDLHIGPHLAAIKARGIKVVANAGGLNPEGLAALIRERGKAQGIALKVATVTGDDLIDRAADLRKRGLTDMYDGRALPETGISSLHVYLGAFPIAAALDAGADIVITGRVVDSALILGPLIHEFGWTAADHDLLAGGTVAGHLLECGAQVTGGTFTDWRDVPDWAGIGFPIGECHADGTVIITKPPQTGGLVSVGTVAEQLLYEVGDPQAYIVPDVVCDFSGITVEQVGPDRVRVAGARGYPAPPLLKLCATVDAGWRSIALIPVIGIDAVAKAERQAAALIERVSGQLRERGLGDWTRTYVEVIGTEAGYGARARPLSPREVLLKIIVDHPQMAAAALFGREQTTAIMNMAPGTSIAPIIAAPRAQPLTDMVFALIGRDGIAAQVAIDGVPVPYVDPVVPGFDPAAIVRAPVPPLPNPGADAVTVPLVALAFARSGDKGRLFNVAAIAREPRFLPWISAALTPDAVADWYRHCFADPTTAQVESFAVPGCHAVNLIVDEAQGGGINLSPRLDPAAKGMGQHLLEFPIPVPAALAAELEGTTR
ncbi:acyclic terpene utilization AtuA family protein [Novosphingobium sp.]|uniref:acyclic terpene utilization AtuA family protein n=1 Tax=Novosphingobium sp. TaxID=1874826 RepID=UPI00333E99C1